MGNADNPSTGARFEAAVQAFFRSKGLDLHRDYSVDVGAGSTPKSRKFDLGSGRPATLVECKSHTWTEGGNAPSAKLSVWNEAMFYFLVAPPSYRKILAVLAHSRQGETLAEHYVKRFRHLVPPGIMGSLCGRTFRAARLHWLLRPAPAIDWLGYAASVSPTVFRVKGFRFYFFSREERRAHVHVQHAGGEVKFWIEPTVALAANFSLKPKQVTEVQKLIEEHLNEIRSAWAKHFPGGSH